MLKQIELYVDDDYFDLVPRPTKVQRKALKESIQKDGQQEPIVIDESGRILDGHTRFEICQELSLKPKYIIKGFKDQDEKKRYAVTVNLKRRHLNDYQIFELLQKEFEMIQNKNESERRKRISDIRRGLEVSMIKREWQRSKSITQLSQISGVKVQTLEQCKIVKEFGDKTLQEKVRSGIITPRHAYEKLRHKKWDKLHKPNTYRSKFGIVFDLLRVIKEGDKMKISIISRQANLSHYSTKENLELLIKVNLIKIEKEVLNYKYYKNKYSNQYFKLTDKGQIYYKKCVELYEFLPHEFARELQN